jgi:hypothetical protein
VLIVGWLLDGPENLIAWIFLIMELALIVRILKEE